MLETQPTQATRRRILVSFVAGAAALAANRAFAQQAAMQEKASIAANATKTTLHYEIEFKVPPHHIYAALLDAKQFTTFTGMAAEIDANPGGAFKMFGGLIEGRNVELIEGQRIVQAWRPSSWAAGIYSIAHFEIKPRGDGSTLVFDHTGFPAGLADHLDVGWKGHYWEPMKKYFS